MKRREELELRIEDMAFGGRGIARLDGFVVFVPGAVPGDRIRASITKVKKSFAEARLLEILDPAPHRIPAPCAHFDHCGGCKWQNLPYEVQLAYKKNHVRDLVIRVGGLDDVIVHDPLPANPVFGYRNKMEFSFAEAGWLRPEQLQDKSIPKEFAIGFHLPGRFDRILNIERCLLQSDLLNGILTDCRKWFRESGMPVYHSRLHTGLLRFLVFRESINPHQIMINLVTSRDVSGQLDGWVQQITDCYPEVVSMINTVNERRAQVAQGQSSTLLYGEPRIEETIGQYRFSISPDAFFQTNSRQAEHLYEVVRRFAGDSADTLWDLYCGTGTIAIYLSDIAKQVRGFELVENAVKDAGENARFNGVKNCSFVSGDIKDCIDQYVGEHPDVIVCDPPRAGMHPSVVKAIVAAAPERIVYVSCDPATMSRDLALLCEAYDVKEIQPVDMFPHTYHIESVARLERIG